MTNITEQFFKTFGIEPKYKIDIGRWDNKTNTRKPLNVIISEKEYTKGYKNNKLTPLIDLIYPEITAEILLKLLCIYNNMQGCLEFCITPCSYEDTKDMILNTLIGEKLSMKDCEEGTYMDVMTKRIQSLFREEGE